MLSFNDITKWLRGGYFKKGIWGKNEYFSYSSECCQSKCLLSLTNINVCFFVIILKKWKFIQPFLLKNKFFYPFRSAYENNVYFSF
jgi:hypothetical protein